MTGAEKLKSICFKCGVNKWIVDYKEGCAANISRNSTCLFCQMAERIEKLEKENKNKDNTMKDMEKKMNDRNNLMEKMENALSKLEKKVEDLEGMKSGTNVKGLANGEVRKNDENTNIKQGNKESQEVTEEVKKLSSIIKENRDTIIESGREIVEIREEIVAMKNREEFQTVKGRKAARGSRVEEVKEIKIGNRFAVLSQEETFLIGDSIVREQEDSFANMNRQKRKVKSFPGCKTKKVVEEVRKLKLQSKNSTVITHVGSNDLFLRGNKTGNSEQIVKDLKSLVDITAEKSSNGIIIGLLPRWYASHYALSKAIGINDRIKEHCTQKKVEFLDLWDTYKGKWHYFKEDGVHLSERGHKKLGDVLTRRCEELMGSASSAADGPSNTSNTLMHEDPTNDAHEYSFEGFSTGN